MLNTLAWGLGGLAAIGALIMISAIAIADDRDAGVLQFRCRLFLFFVLIGSPAWMRLIVARCMC